MTLTAPIYVPTPGYCMTGLYRGYNGDGLGVGQTATQMNAIQALTGQPVEVVTISNGKELTWGSTTFTSCNGMPQHLMVQMQLCPASGANASCAATAAGNNDTLFHNIYNLIPAAMNNKTKMTIVLGWEAGLGGFPWAPGVGSNTWANYISAFQHVVTLMNGYGYAGGWAFDCGYADFTDIAQAAAALAPYIDYFDFHSYNGIRSISATPRTNIPLWIANDLQPRLDKVTATAVTYNKLCSVSEYALEQPATGDTSSNVYTYHTADTNLYFSFLQTYWGNHADRWVMASFYSQNQPGSSAGVVVTEDNQMIYLGTDPTTQATANLRNTNGTGPAYWTPSPHHSLSLPDYQTSVMIAGSMQLEPVAPPSSIPIVKATVEEVRRGQTHWMTF